MLRVLTQSLLHTLGKLVLAIMLINMLYDYIHGRAFAWQGLLDLEALPEKLVALAAAGWEWGVLALEGHLPLQ